MIKMGKKKFHDVKTHVRVLCTGINESTMFTVTAVISDKETTIYAPNGMYKFNLFPMLLPKHIKNQHQHWRQQHTLTKSMETCAWKLEQKTSDHK